VVRYYMIIIVCPTFILVMLWGFLRFSCQKNEKATKTQKTTENNKLTNYKFMHVENNYVFISNLEVFIIFYLFKSFHLFMPPQCGSI
jgi:amino acid permease